MLNANECVLMNHSLGYGYIVYAISLFWVIESSWQSHHITIRALTAIVVMIPRTEISQILIIQSRDEAILAGFYMYLVLSFLECRGITLLTCKVKCPSCRRLRREENSGWPISGADRVLSPCNTLAEIER